MIEKMLRIGRLYDCYGALLTENQQKCLELHYLQDLSLGEIAAELSVSRQAVNDMLRLTSTDFAPWTIIESENKQFGRIKALETAISAIEARL